MRLLCHNQRARQPHRGIFWGNYIQGPSANMALLLPSCFSVLGLPSWFHRLINVKHQTLVSLIMGRKGLKNSGICASEQRLYQLAPVTASWKKKMLLIKNQHTWFPKGCSPRMSTFNYKGFLSQLTITSSSKSHLSSPRCLTAKG